MHASSWTPVPALPRPTRRFATALVLSAGLHALVSVPSGPGSNGRSRPATVPASVAITVSLVAAEPRLQPAEPQVERKPIAAPSLPQEPRKSAQAPPRAAAPGPERSAGIADPTYYAVRQLDVYPALASPVELVYPAAAAASNVKGRVLLLLLIDASGTVDDASVVEAEPAGYFEHEARRTLRSARFKPALKDGRAVKSRILVNVDYGDARSAP